MEDNLLVFFWLFNFFLETWAFSSRFHRKNSSVFTKRRITCADERYGTFPSKCYVAFSGCWNKFYERRPKTFQQCFWKCLQYVHKNVLVVFFPQKGISSLGFWTSFSRCLIGKKLALISKLQDTFAKEQLAKFCHKKQFFNQIIRARSFLTRSENLRQKSAFVFFCIERAFSYFFPRDIGFLSDCALKSSRLQGKIFSSVFQSAFKIRKAAFLCFLSSCFFLSRNLIFFCRSLSKNNSAVFSKQQNTCSEKQFVIFLPKKRFFQFCTLSKKSPFNFFSSLIVRRGHFGFFLKILCFVLGLCEQKFRGRQKTLRSAHESAFKVCRRMFQMFFVLQKLSILSCPQHFFSRSLSL